MLKIAIYTPVHGSPRTAYTRSLGQMLIHTTRQRPDLELRYKIAEGHLIANRNDLAKDAAEWAADFHMLIDADMAYPETSLIDLLAHDLDVVGANYAARQNPPVPTAMRDRKIVYTLQASIGLEQVDGIGLGLVLIRSSVLAALGKPLFVAEPNARYPGEDKYLCGRLRARGVLIHIDHDLSKKVGHIAEHPYTNDVVEAFARREGLVS
jgi:hypothetical protein